VPVNFVPSITAATTLPFGITCATFSPSPYSELAAPTPVEVCVLSSCRGGDALFACSKPRNALQLPKQDHGLDRTAVPRIPALIVVLANVLGFEDV